MPHEAWRKFFVSFCGSGDFSQKCALEHSKIKLLFFPTMYNNYYHVLCMLNTALLLFSSDVALRRLLSYKTFK